MKRVVFDIILIAVVVLLPWWVSVILSLAAIFYFNNFFEAAFVGLLLDSLYGTSSVFSDFPYLLTTIFTLITLFLIYFKKKLVMY